MHALTDEANGKTKTLITSTGSLWAVVLHRQFSIKERFLATYSVLTKLQLNHWLGNRYRVR